MSQNIRQDDQVIASRLILEAGDRIEMEGGSYLVMRLLGEGGFGTVYQVQDAAGNSYALKTLKLWEIMPQEQEEIADRFIREYKAGQIDSPYIVHSLHYGRLQGNPCIIMEFCPGGNLLDRMQDFHDAEAYTGIAEQVLYGLQALHTEGIVHRDIKPENILFDPGGKARLTDFGIAGFVNKRATRPNWRGHVKQVWGTVVYMAPEQQDYRKAFKSLGPATDMFAFGVMSYQVLTGGNFPFGSFDEYLADPQAYHARMRNGEWAPLSQYRPDLRGHLWEALTRACLAPDPEDRLGTPREVLAKMGRTESPKITDPHNRSKPPLAPGTRWTLKVLNGDGSGTVYHLNRLAEGKGKSLLTLGWLDTDAPQRNDIGILDRHSDYISSFHATLEYDGRQWHIRDGQWCDKYGDGKMGWHFSTNGTRVNYFPVDRQQGCGLLPGDIIVVGDTTLKIETEP